jgi:exopolyphosphatase/guanosine-5'-triphosphate,3'-diphosphate pyrophosphatase
VPPEVVSGDEEAALSFDGATRDLDAAAGPFLVVDVGGGSTELVLGTEQVEAALSVDVGCVRLTERHLRSDPPDGRAGRRRRGRRRRRPRLVREVVPVEQARAAVGLAGSVTTVAAHALQLPRTTPAIHLARLSGPRCVRRAPRCWRCRAPSARALPYMHPGRVDVIGAGRWCCARWSTGSAGTSCW